MDFCQSAIAVIKTEGQAILALTSQIDKNFNRACELILACHGRVVVTGMGKSGHIGKKISSTFSSTGTPSFFMHPAEASHGDLGMLTSQDVVLAISYSGQTEEITTILPLVKRLKIPLIAITANRHSILAKDSQALLMIKIDSEACPLGLAPTTSTTAALVLGDALAVALLTARDFKMEDFARSHPNGNLGKRLNLTVQDIAHQKPHLPVVLDNCFVSQALIEVTEKKLGMTCVVNKAGNLVGVYTDGDIRRTLNNKFDINVTPIAQVMTTHSKTVTCEMLAIEALSLMKQYNISALVVVDDYYCPTGVVHLHDLLNIGIF